MLINISCSWKAAMDSFLTGVFLQLQKWLQYPRQHILWKGLIKYLQFELVIELHCFVCFVSVNNVFHPRMHHCPVLIDIPMSYWEIRMEKEQENIQMKMALCYWGFNRAISEQRCSNYSDVLVGYYFSCSISQRL